MSRNNTETQANLLEKSEILQNKAEEIAELNAKYAEVQNAMLSEFVSLMQTQIIPSPYIKNRIIIGKVVELNKKQGIVIVDCGLKSEAIVNSTIITGNAAPVRLLYNNVHQSKINV